MWGQSLVVEEESRDERRTQHQTARDVGGIYLHVRGIYLHAYRNNLHDTQCGGLKVDSQAGGGRQHNGTVVQYGKSFKYTTTVDEMMCRCRMNRYQAYRSNG